MIRQLYDVRARLRGWFGGAARRYLQRDPEAVQLDQIRHDVEAVLGDMSLITRHDAGPSILLRERLFLLGLDRAYVEAAQNATFLKLQETCSACDSWRRCARDLARGDVNVGMERYCNNAIILDALVAERHKGSS